MYIIHNQVQVIKLLLDIHYTFVVLKALKIGPICDDINSIRFVTATFLWKQTKLKSFKKSQIIVMVV